MDIEGLFNKIEINSLVNLTANFLKSKIIGVYIFKNSRDCLRDSIPYFARGMRIIIFI